MSYTHEDARALVRFLWALPKGAPFSELTRYRTVEDEYGSVRAGFAMSCGQLVRPRRKEWIYDTIRAAARHYGMWKRGLGGPYGRYWLGVAIFNEPCVRKKGDRPEERSPILGTDPAKSGTP